MLSGTSFAAPFVTAVAAIVYQDTGLERAAKTGRTPLDPKRVMLAQLFGNDASKQHSPVYGRGVIKAPPSCGRQAWGSIVTPAPAIAPVTPVTWQQPIVKRAALPLEAGR